MRIPAMWIPASALALALVASPAAAQRGMMGGGPPGQRNREQLEQRIRARFGEQIRRRLGLDDQTARELNATVESFQKERGDLARDQEALRKRVEAFAIEGNGSDQEAQQLLNRMDELQNRERHLYETEQDSLKKVLSPSQLLLFNVMREQLAQRIQQLRMSGMMGRGRGPVPGRPGGGGGGGGPGF